MKQLLLILFLATNICVAQNFIGDVNIEFNPKSLVIDGVNYPTDSSKSTGSVDIFYSGTTLIQCTNSGVAINNKVYKGIWKDHLGGNSFYLVTDAGIRETISTQDSLPPYNMSYKHIYHHPHRSE